MHQCNEFRVTPEHGNFLSDVRELFVHGLKVAAVFNHFVSPSNDGNIDTFVRQVNFWFVNTVLQTSVSRFQ
jgi:hypothetical protein